MPFAPSCWMPRGQPICLAVVHHLTLLQVDPTAAVAPNADLVAWSRLGSAYQPAHLQQALEQDRTLFELDAMIRPMGDLGLFLGDMAKSPPYDKQREWLRVNDRFRRDVLERLGSSGPLLSRDIPDTSQVAWPSSGWTNNRNVTQMLEFLMMRGEIAITARRGRQRVWDLADRVYPATAAVKPEEARRVRQERRLRALGIAREKFVAMPLEPVDVGNVGEPATVEGVPGTWRVDPDALGKPFEGRTALLSPFDRLIYDRARAVDLFDFEYLLEMYKPAAKRRWGFFALPVLTRIGSWAKWTPPPTGRAPRCGCTRSTRTSPSRGRSPAGVRGELKSLASWLGLGSIDYEG